MNSPDKVNNIKIRFLAYRNKNGNAQTSHDSIKLSVTYNLPDPDPIPESQLYTEISSDITEDTIWTKENNPYVITQPISILGGVEFTIESGVIVKFKPNASIAMSEGGAINAVGAPTDQIYFTSFSDDEIGEIQMEMNP